MSTIWSPASWSRAERCRLPWIYSDLLLRHPGAVDEAGFAIASHLMDLAALARRARRCRRRRPARGVRACG